MSLILLYPHLQMTQLVWMSVSKDRPYYYHGNVDKYSTQCIHNTNVEKKKGIEHQYKQQKVKSVQRKHNQLNAAIWWGRTIIEKQQCLAARHA